MKITQYGKVIVGFPTLVNFVNVTNITNGTYFWSVTNSGDFGTSTGSFTITSNTGSFTVTPTADTTTEGAETFTASVRTGSVSGTVVATSSTITINDTSTSYSPPIPTPTYTITLDGDNVNEGDLFGVEVTGSNISDGTYYWTVSNSGDFGTASGSFSIISNIGSFELAPTADTTTEGAETFIVSIRTGSVSGTVVATSSSVTINDTSTTPILVPTYAVSPATGTVNEGSALTFNVTTTGVANGTTLYWSVINPGDFGTSSGSFTITSNTGSFSVTPTADTSTEGAETFTASVRTGSLSGTIVATSSSVTINDTSTTPSGFVPDYTITVTNSGNNYLLSGTARNGTFSSASQPALVFNNGDKVRFSVDAGTSSMHPFFIKTIQSIGTGNQVAAVSGGGTTTLEWTTNNTGVGSYGYQCSIHLGMWNTITIS